MISRRKIYEFNTQAKANAMIDALNKAQQQANTYVNISLTHKLNKYIVVMG
jgi:uncharacterized FlaG/YvyC family protein